MRLLGNEIRVFADGTFSVVPPPFSQLFIISFTVVRFGVRKLFPGIFVLMTKRTIEAYTQVLAFFKRYFNEHFGTDVHWAELLIDFEAAIWSAFLMEFPEADISGCYFHWTQCLQRHLAGVGLARIANNRESIFNIVIRSIKALAFLSIDEVIAAYHEVIEPGFEALMGERELAPLHNAIAIFKGEHIRLFVSGLLLFL